MAHKIFLFFLVFIGLTTTVAIGLRGCSFYFTPLEERPFHPEYDELKPSGRHGIELGAIGAAMVTIGVAMYSTRKRVRKLWAVGQLSRWLEVHIFLCLLGPVLVVYHSTFKSGGVAAISLWCMLSVAASGVVGRFLYVLIPRNIKGNELSSSQIQDQLQHLGDELSTNEVGQELIRLIDEKFASVPEPHTLHAFVSAVRHLQRIKHEVKKSIQVILRLSVISKQSAQHLYDMAYERASLRQKSILLAQAGRIFYYWHAIHLPFTVIMFITLILHVVVVMMLGYTWRF